MRELREETGYEGKVLSLSPTIVSDPGYVIFFFLSFVFVRHSGADEGLG